MNFEITGNTLPAGGGHSGEQGIIKIPHTISSHPENERSYWQEYIEGKEIWMRPVALRVMYGADPQKIADPKKRAKAEKGIQARRMLIDRITEAVREGKCVADLQEG